MGVEGTADMVAEGSALARGGRDKAAHPFQVFIYARLIASRAQTNDKPELARQMVVVDKTRFDDAARSRGNHVTCTRRWVSP